MATGGFSWLYTPFNPRIVINSTSTFFFLIFWFRQDHYPEKKGSNDNSPNLSQKAFHVRSQSRQGGGRSDWASSCGHPGYRPWSLLCLVRAWKDAFAARGMVQGNCAGGDVMEIKDKQRRDVCETMIMWVPEYQ